MRHRSEGGLFAMKVLRKAHMSAKNQAVHALSERNALAAAAASTSWIVRLHWSFQDDSALFLVMDLCSGYVYASIHNPGLLRPLSDPSHTPPPPPSNPRGDFMSLLIREDVLPEAAMRFYAAEAICALEEVHALGFVHRDIKPDNLLLTATGHLRLTDLGLAARIAAPAAPDAPSDATGGAVGGLSARARLLSTVGTPDYLAPEVLRREGYGALVGCVLWGLHMRPLNKSCPPRRCLRRCVVAGSDLLRGTHWGASLVESFPHSCSSHIHPPPSSFLHSLRTTQSPRARKCSIGRRASSGPRSASLR